MVSRNSQRLKNINLIKNTTVIIPAKNENIGIKICIELIFMFVPQVKEIIIVLESESDLTIGFIKQARIKEDASVRILINQQSPGVTGSILTGIHQSLGKYILIYPADEINPIFNLSLILNKLDEGYDLVSATRYGNGGLRLGVGVLSGNIMSQLLSFVVFSLSKGKLSDISTGIKAFNKENILIPDKPFSQQGWSFPMEIELKAIKAKKLITEVPIISVDRPFGGKSNYKARVWIIDYLKVSLRILLS
jgi:dolichol-phosphate mannosyltransferase